MTLLSTDFGDLIAQRIKAAHRDLARLWLDRLKDVLSVEVEAIFPSEQLLDHVPALLLEIADYVGTATGEAIVANTLVVSKARELGELRFEQKATIHQLLKEYRLLGSVLAEFVEAELETLDAPVPLAESVAIMKRLNEAVFVLLQTTVDTFVGRYSDQIDSQTTRLESFNRMVSHELRQPLSAVQSAVELLRHPAAAPGQREKFFEVATRNLRRLSHLLGLLGAIARPGGEHLQIQEVDVAKVIHDVLGQLSDAADARAVALVADAPSATCAVDVSRLELALVNLVSNGIKYRDPAKARPSVAVTIDPSGTGCRISVADNGLGIPAEEHHKVFQRFYRGHATRDHELENDGAGLGLAIAAECVKAMGGRLSFESTAGEGTTFTITLPPATRA